MSRENDTPVLTVSAAAGLAGMHAQTLRQYDRLGLVVPHRTAGQGRRYSLRDVDALREIQRLSLEGVNLEGIARILALEREIAALNASLESLRAVTDPGSRVFAASPSGDVEAVPRGRRAARRRAVTEHRELATAGVAGVAGVAASARSSTLVLWRGQTTGHRER